MAIAEKARETLAPKHFTLPADPPVVELRVDDYCSYDGEPALRVWAILDEAAEVESLSGESLARLAAKIRQALRDRGIEEFAYISFVKQSELDDAVEE